MDDLISRSSVELTYHEGPIENEQIVDHLKTEVIPRVGEVVSMFNMKIVSKTKYKVVGVEYRYTTFADGNGITTKLDDVWGQVQQL